MKENEEYILDRVRHWVWSGFHTPHQVAEMVEDLDDADCDWAMIETTILAEAEQKRLAEQSWPAETDCDRLDAVFKALDAQGIIGLHNAGHTRQDGFDDVTEAVAQADDGRYHGYVFYHGQDLERALSGMGVMLAYGDLTDDDERGLAVAREVVEALKAAGFPVDWNGTIEERINLPTINWQRRSPEAGSHPLPQRAAPAPEATFVAGKPWWKFW